MRANNPLAADDDRASIAALAVLLMVGVVFGLIPANRTAKTESLGGVAP
jgi:hypothetical protein